MRAWNAIALPPADPPPRLVGSYLAVSIVGLLLFVGFRIWLPSLPNRQWLEEELHGRVVAYEVTPAGGFVAIADDRRVIFDGLRADFWSFNNWPPFWRWQLIGLGHGAPRTLDPASVALAACPGTSGDRCGTAPWIFGEVTDPRIVAVEVDRAGATVRHPVAEPGFAIQLGPLSDGPAPTAYRWLDAEDRVIWQADHPIEGRWPGEPRLRDDRDRDREQRRDDRRQRRERRQAAEGQPAPPAASDIRP